MNKTTEALKMAIEALDESMPLVFGNGIALEMMKTPLLEVERKVNFHKKAINACKEALKSQEQVTYTHKWDRCGERCLKCGDKDWMGGACSVPDSQEQEPVDWASKLREWNDCTGALPANGSWFWEVVCMLEEASNTHPAPSQEPVAWTGQEQLKWLKKNGDDRTAVMWKEQEASLDIPLYTHPCKDCHK